MKCPGCGLLNSGGAKKCDSGLFLTTKQYNVFTGLLHIEWVKMRGNRQRGHHT